MARLVVLVGLARLVIGGDIFDVAEVGVFGDLVHFF